MEESKLKLMNEIDRQIEKWSKEKSKMDYLWQEQYNSLIKHLQRIKTNLILI